MTSSARGRALTAIAVAVPVLFLGYFFAYPVIAITVRGLAHGDAGLRGVWDVLSDRGLQRVAWFTVWQATLSTVLTVAIGLPAAWVFARFSFPGKRILSAITLVPFVLPTLVVATAFLGLVGPRGLLGFDMTGTIWIILAAHVFYNLSIVIRGVGSFWARIDPRLAEASRTLGASTWRTFTSVELPLLRPIIASTAALVFLFSFTSFGVVVVLGDLTHSTIEVEIWRQAMSFLRLDVASTLAILQIVGVSALLFLYGRFERRTSVPFHHRLSTPPRPRGTRQVATVTAIVVSTFALAVGPLAVLAVRSFANPGGGFGLENYRNLAALPERSGAFVSTPLAIGNSLRFAVIAVVVASLIGLLAALAIQRAPRRTSGSFDLFVMLPLGTSAVTIGFGFLVALHWPMDLRGTLILIPIAHALVGIPFVVRTINPTLASVRGDLKEAAATLGASPWKTFVTIDLRLVSRALLVGAAFAFAISMGEFGATTFIVRPNSPTIPIAIFRFLGRPGAEPFGAALALSAVLMAVTAVVVAAIDASDRGQERRI